MTALCVAFSLSPVSVLSTTSILAAAFQLGTEFNQHAVVQEESRQALQAEHDRLVARADQAQAAWETECARGGCRPLARQLKADFRAIVGEAQTVLDQILELNEAAQNQSELLARLVTTFEELGIFGQERLMWLPLFLAISLEIGMVEVDGHNVMFKIDAYDQNLEHGSPDPTDPSVTTRVLTILLASEY